MFSVGVEESPQDKAGEAHHAKELGLSLLRKGTSAFSRAQYYLKKPARNPVVRTKWQPCNKQKEVRFTLNTPEEDLSNDLKPERAKSGRTA